VAGGGVTAKQQLGGPGASASGDRAAAGPGAGTLGTAAIAAMDERLPWYRKMSAETVWLGLVAQAGSRFLDWIRHPERNRPQ